MNLDPEIRDQAYQFFIEEAPELLEAIETGLINLHTDVSAARLHNIMRAAHSIKGGAAGVGLPGIKSLAHRLETIVKALYSDQVQLDTTLENQLLQAYDCLRFPLETQIDQGDYDEADALATAEPIFQAIEERLGPALAQADNFLPSSSELGIDMVAALFEVDVQQGLDRLQQVVAQPQDHELMGELQAQTEVFSGFAEILNLPGFGKICEVANRAVSLNPGNIIAILQQSILDFAAARELVLAGDREQGGAPSAELLALAQLDSAPIFPELDSAPVADDSTLIPVPLQEDYDLSDIFGESLSNPSDNNGTSLQTGVDDYDLSEILDEPIADTNSQTGVDDYDLSEILDEPVADEGSPIGAEENAIGDWLTAAEPPDIWDLPDGEPNGIVDEPAIAIQADSDLIWGEPNGITPETLGEEATLIQDEHEVVDIEATFIQDESGLIWGESEPVIDERVDQDATVIQDEYDLAELFQAEDSDLSAASSTADPDPRVDIWGLDAEPSPLTVNDPVPEITTLEEAIPAEASSDGPTPDINVVETALTGAAAASLPTLDAALQAVSEQYETLPVPDADAISAPPPTPEAEVAPPVLPRRTVRPKPQTGKSLTARIALDRLERMDNYVGELVINRNGLSLQNEQFQRTVRHLQQRFGTFRTLAKQLQTLSDKILTNPDRVNSAAANLQSNSRGSAVTPSPLLSATQFDALELDTYSAVNLMLEELLEELLQVEESIEDVNLFAGQSNQKLEKQRQLLTRLRDELMWSRMVPLSGVLNRFPRILRELSTTHHKPVQLELKGAEVLVDRVMLEKLYDPLMHLLRNAFDHGIESPEERRQQGKSKQGTIRIHAYHQGNNTVIEVQDNGRGLDLTRIGQRAVEAGLLSPGDLATTRKQQLYKAIFEPGFSTAAQVSDLSGRGVGLDVGRERLQSFNGKVSVVSEPGQGTTFTL
ncbi:MAG: ATP-binding protein, partial [Leptolyngbyaceae cyanobacterium]